MAVATSRGRGMSAKELKLVVTNLNTVKRGWREGGREGERVGMLTYMYMYLHEVAEEHHRQRYM